MPDDPVPLLARAGIVAPFMVMEVVPATAVIVGLPLQVVEALGGLAIRSCPVPILAAGRLSLTEAAVIVLAEILVRVIVIVETEFSDNGPAGEKTLLAVRVLALTDEDVELEAEPLQVAPAL